jgi:hypothetical protein
LEKRVRPATLQRDEIDGLGFTLLGAVFNAREVEQLRAKLSEVLSGTDPGVIQREGAIVGARNLLRRWTDVANAWRRAPLITALTETLGPRAGLVRVLYFNKPPQRTWALPWHKDLTIAVRDNQRPSQGFRNPTLKAGVPHVEASRAILESMLTARVYLDDITDENGPMTIIPGSHLSGKELHFEKSQARKMLGRRGDVLLIRPMVAHNSLCAQPGNQSHRRILHLEFAAEPELPDGYEWHDYVPISAAS